MRSTKKRQRHRYLYPLLLIGWFALHSCAYDIDQKGGTKGNGDVRKEQRNIAAEFHTIDASEDLTVFVTQAATLNVTVEADANIIDLIGTNREDGTLFIHTHKNIGRATKNVYISLPKISNIIVSKGAILKTTGTIKAESAAVNVGTGSMVKAQFSVDELTVDSKEGASIQLSGSAKKLNATVTSGSSIDAKKFSVAKCQVNAQYGGRLWVHVLDSLEADSNTGAAVYYLGEPSINKEKSLSGTVEKY